MWCWRILPKCHTKLFPLEFSLCKYLPWNLYEWCCHHSRWTYKDSSSGSLETKIQTSFSTCLMSMWHFQYYAAAAAKSLQSCPTLCDPIDCSLSGSAVPGILQARTLEWVAIFFSNAGKWKVKVKSLNHVRLLATPWTAAYQAPPSTGLSRQEYWSGVPLPSLEENRRVNKSRLGYGQHCKGKISKDIF